MESHPAVGYGGGLARSAVRASFGQSSRARAHAQGARGGTRGARTLAELAKGQPPAEAATRVMPPRATITTSVAHASGVARRRGAKWRSATVGAGAPLSVERRQRSADLGRRTRLGLLLLVLQRRNRDPDRGVPDCRSSRGRRGPFRRMVLEVTPIERGLGSQLSDSADKSGQRTVKGGTGGPRNFSSDRRR